MTPLTTADRSGRLRLATRYLDLTVHGTLEQLAEVIHPRFVNREAHAEPPDARGTGPRAAAATGAWLREAFSDIGFDVEEVVVDGDLVVTHGTMSARHDGPFVIYDGDGAVERAFAPTGRSFCVTHTHWLRFADGRCVEHWANRDDQGQALQLGWVPPTPAYLLRCARATRRARRSR